MVCAKRGPETGTLQHIIRRQWTSDPARGHSNPVHGTISLHTRPAFPLAFNMIAGVFRELDRAGLLWYNLHPELRKQQAYGQGKIESRSS